MLIKLNDVLYRVMEVTHLTPGKGKAFVQSRMRNVRAGTLLDHKFRSVDVVERAVLDDREMQFAYRDGDTFHFMDLESYEQIEMRAETLGDSVNYLLPEATIQGIAVRGRGGRARPAADRRFEGRGDGAGDQGSTANAQLKPARLETGLVVQVPPFVSAGDKVRVNTETGDYQSRA